MGFIGRKDEFATEPSDLCRGANAAACRSNQQFASQAVTLIGCGNGQPPKAKSSDGMAAATGRACNVGHGFEIDLRRA